MNTVDGWIVNFFPYQKGSRNPHLVQLGELYDRALNPPEIGGFSNYPGNSNFETFFVYFNLPEQCHMNKPRWVAKLF